MGKKIMHILFLSCLKATGIIEKGLHLRLSWKERLQLKMHKMMCGACRHYEKQSLFLDNVLKAGYDIKPGDNIEPAQEEIRELKKSINEKLEGIK